MGNIENRFKTRALVPAGDAMRRLGFTDSNSFYQFVEREGVPFYRFGRRRKFDPVEIEEFLKKHRVGSAS